MPMKKFQVQFSSATTHDHNFLKKLKCDYNTIYVFDKGYNDYKAFKHFTDNKTGFVTRIKDNAVYEKLEIKDIPENIHSTVLQDEIIEIDVKDGKTISKLKVRKTRSALLNQINF